MGAVFDLVDSVSVSLLRRRWLLAENLDANLKTDQAPR